jgi:hypothetical protein
MSKSTPFLLLLATLGFLTFLLPASLPRDLIMSVVLAIILIILLIVRSQHWHHGDSYDVLIALFVLASIGYFATFSGSMHDAIGITLTALLAALSALLALSLLQDWPYHAARPHATHHPHVMHAPVLHRRQPAVERTGVGAMPRRNLLRRLFKRGVEPIPELKETRLLRKPAEREQPAAPTRSTAPVHTRRATTETSYEPSHEPSHKNPPAGLEPIPVLTKPRRVRTFLRRVFRRSTQTVTHEQAITGKSPGAAVDPVAISAPPEIEPIAEIAPPRAGKPHTDSFKQGIEAIPELDDADATITSEHLHKLGVYDLEPLQELVSRAAPRRTVFRVASRKSPVAVKLPVAKIVKRKQARR